MGAGDKIENNASDANGVVLYGVQEGTTTLKRITVDSSGRVVMAPSGTLSHVKKSVSAAGTPERAVASSTPVKKAWVCADPDAGIIIVLGGDNTVRATTNNKNGLVLIPGNQSEQLDIDDLYDLWVDAESNGGILCVAYIA